MKLTTDILAAYGGGQLEVQNVAEGYLFRGEIKTAVMNEDGASFTLKWMAKGEGFPPFPTGWVADDHLAYDISLELYNANNIGPSGDEIGGGDRLCLQSSITGEIVILYPPDGSKLDPAKVKGLTCSCGTAETEK